MLDGVIFTWRDLPDVLVTEHRLDRHLFTPNEQSDRQYRFLHEQSPRLIPVWLDGQLKIAFWGSSEPPLPRQGTARHESVERGVWGNLRPIETVVPCPFAIAGGRTYQTKEGIKCLIVRDRQKRPHAYVLSEPSSPYYFTMTRRDRMPVFVAEEFGKA